MRLERRTSNYSRRELIEPGHVTFVMEDPIATQVVIEALRLIFKKPTLIHKGGKP